MSSASATEHASVIVQLELRSPLRRIWRYVGYDEPNDTDTPNGHALLAKLAEMSDGPYCIRCHFILCSGDGTPNLTITLPSHSACLLQFVAVIQ